MNKLLIIPFILFTQPSLSNDLDTYWELGAGTVAAVLPLYPGSADNKSYLIPFPYLRFQSKYLEVEDGVRGFFFESPNLRMNISGDLGVPVDSNDSQVRHGMPDLDATLQVGPSLEIIFAGGRKQPSEFRLELPVRAAIATNLKDSENLGWVIEPRITYETLRPLVRGWSHQISSGVRYASEDYHAYYYDVPVTFATPQRNAYKSDGGYSAYFLDLSVNWRNKDLVYFTFLRYQNLSGAEYADSPLVEETHYYSIGVGMIWLITDSRR